MKTEKYIYHSLYSIAGPLKLTVELKGKAKDAQSTKPGLYILGPNEVNGRSHWVQDSGTMAIWYDKSDGDWNIGHQDNIGKTSAAIGIYTTEDVAGPQGATTWKYSSGDEWITSDTDVLVNTFKPGMYINRRKTI